MEERESVFWRRDGLRALLEKALYARTRDALDRRVGPGAPPRRDATPPPHPFCDEGCGECMIQRI